jgi:hypothetical protein
MKAATELLAKYPMLQVEIYDAAPKSRTLVEQQSCIPAPLTIFSILIYR